MKFFKNEIAGMNSHYRYYQLETFFEKMKELKITCVELWLGPMHFYVDAYGYDNPKQLKELMAKYKIKIIGICPQQSNPNLYNIASKFHQGEVLNYYENVMKVAKDIGCCQVLVTSGWAYYDEPIEEARERSIKMIRKIAQIANRYGVTLVMEALQASESRIVTSISQLQSFLEEADIENLKVCIDFGAMAKAQESINDYFEAFSSRIKHIHFVDGNPSGHLAWGEGSRNMFEDLQCLHKYKYEGYLTLEMAASRYAEVPWISEMKTLQVWTNIQGGKR